MSREERAAPSRLEAGDGTSIAVDLGGHGERAVVLLHGLTATRRYVVHGSRLLERSGCRVLAYDARGHGESSPAPRSEAYEYGDMVADLEAVLEAAGVGRAALVGHSMGAATAISFALRHAERVDRLVAITPAYRGTEASAEELESWDELADGLERDGVDGFMSAYRPQVGERWREQVMRFTRQRLERHRHPAAVADALRVVPRSLAFGGLEALGRVEAPALVVGSRDDSDPGHPLEVAESYAERLPDGRLVVEGPGEVPLAWRGAQLSRTIADFLDEPAT